MSRKTSKKNTKTQKAAVRTPVKDLQKGETIEHYNAVLLEDIRSKMEQVIEGMEGTEISLKKEMEHLEKKLIGEFELLKGVVHHHSTRIDLMEMINNSSTNKIKECALQVTENNKKIDALQNQIAQMETNLSDKIDSIHTRLDEHEAKPVNIAHPAQ